LVKDAFQTQHVIGLYVLKGFNDSHVESSIYSHKGRFIHDYHFGGYAKKNEQLIDFMNCLYVKYDLPSDFVYTAKLFYGAFDLISKDYFQGGDRLLVIHSGGLQGNRSLPPGTLLF
jgi:1-aminocyclopropane-1-carboxylate deaminase/D-cysteine desulfhydrase-like pyridoxal-dependent ACC family enzyme